MINKTLSKKKISTLRKPFLQKLRGHYGKSNGVKAMAIIHGEVIPDVALKSTLLNFQHGNAKLKRDTAILSLPAGHTCPFAKDCRSSTDKATGQISDGPHTKFRCYATTAEAMFPNIRASRWANLELIKQAKTAIGIAALIEKSLAGKKKIKLVRFHQSGDFFSQTYFDAWLMVAQCHPELIFYGYTKALLFWVKRLHSIPANFKLVASRGGTHDYLIEMFALRSARVVYSEREAKRKWKLEIDHDDSHVWKYDKDFAIVIHGTQPAGTKASKAWQKIKVHGKGGYKSDYFSHYRKGQKKKTVTVPVVTVKNKAGKIIIHSPKVLPYSPMKNGVLIPTHSPKVYA